MILRIVFGHFAGDDDADALVELRDRLTRAARAVDGLESLILGARRHALEAASVRVPGPGDPIQAAIVTVWRDAETMVRATAVDEQERFLATRLRLDFRVDRTDHYEIVGRTFAALPPDRPALVRILTVTAGPTDEASLVDTLRSQQLRLVEHGLVASHLGRRITSSGTVETVHVSVWPDHATVVAATGGTPEMPFFAHELQTWREHLTLELFDGIEIAPLLPVPSGAPLLILDDQTRIVDLTTAAAAMLGMASEQLVGASMPALAARTPGLEPVDWTELSRAAELAGEMALAVPAVGEILLRFVARRDAPVAGRHAVLVRRQADEAPTPADLAAALTEAFPPA